MKLSDLKEFDILKVETTLDCGLRPGVEPTVIHIDREKQTATCLLQFSITAEELALDRVRKIGVYIGDALPATKEELEMAASDSMIGESIKADTSTWRAVTGEAAVTAPVKAGKRGK